MRYIIVVNGVVSRKGQGRSRHDNAATHDLVVSLWCRQREVSRSQPPWQCCHTRYSSQLSVSSAERVKVTAIWQRCRIGKLYVYGVVSRNVDSQL
ncbi:hypothetical protein BaRGS_00038291 [Batillaria attramentaria]|uniref:Uncharacterized protein n=1 Tax=Batillaria attramentaria TaxID=370345 RepID=A0ABD0J6G1_9CAEN